MLDISSLDFLIGDQCLLFLCQWLVDAVNNSNTLILKDNHMVFDEERLRNKDSSNSDDQKRLLIIECLEVVLSILGSQLSRSAMMI